jgi:tRNA (cytidine/uridine-2'-O-)-methyltransferase
MTGVSENSSSSPTRGSSRLHIALIEPEIPPNTGNIARLCAATFTTLHLVGKLGFRTDDKAVRRAGLDYWREVEIHYHLNMEALYEALPGSRFLYFTTKSSRAYTTFQFAENDCLVFGSETRGLPEELLRENWERALTIPMPNQGVRSLNLATSVGIVLYEALRQFGFRAQPSADEVIRTPKV